jgi:hypothetical protein
MWDTFQNDKQTMKDTVQKITMKDTVQIVLPDLVNMFIQFSISHSHPDTKTIII